MSSSKARIFFIEQYEFCLCEYVFLSLLVIMFKVCNYNTQISWVIMIIGNSFSYLGFTGLVPHST